MKVWSAFFAVTLLAVTEAVFTGETIVNIVKNSLPLGEGEGVNIRFQCSPGTLEERWKLLSVGCAECLTTRIFNSTTFPSSLRGLCRSCGEPLYRLVLDCVGDSAKFLRSLDALCAANENGVTCYNAIAGDNEGKDMFFDCQLSPCSDTCRRELRDSNEAHGCCLFSMVAALSDIERAQGLWSRCDVEPPSLCSGAFTSSSSTRVVDSSTSTSSTSKNEFNFLSLIIITLSFLLL